MKSFTVFFDDGTKAGTGVCNGWGRTADEVIQQAKSHLRDVGVKESLINHPVKVTLRVGEMEHTVWSV